VQIAVGEPIPFATDHSAISNMGRLKKATLRRFSDGAAIFNFSRRDFGENGAKAPCSPS
jgi:hypothetical protein